MPDKSSTNLLDLPPEILTHIFTFICPKWHLNDIDIEPQRGQQHQRRYRAKLHMFQLPGYPAPKTPPAFASLRSICTTLRPIASRAIHDSFTGHAHISCNRTILMCPRPWMSVLHRVQTVSVDLSYCDVIFHEVHAPKLPNLQSMKLYCYRDYCWRPQPPGTSPACLDRMLETKEYDALFQSEAVKSVVDNSGHEFLRGLPPGLAELTWYQCFDFSDEWDGVLIIEYEIQDIGNIPSDFYDHWILRSKRYIVLDDEYQLAMEVPDTEHGHQQGPELRDGFFVTSLGVP